VKVTTKTETQVVGVNLELTVDEAKHLAHRLDVSSYVSFDEYRKANGIAREDMARHPFADEIIAAFVNAGVTI
jgi:hypothetical protein